MCQLVPRYSTDCLGEQARIHVEEGNLAALKCPEPGCAAAIPHAVLQGLLPQEQFARWERLTLVGLSLPGGCQIGYMGTILAVIH
jgi:hypothetical protein